MGNKVKREIVASIAAIVAVLMMSYAFASVFVYYPVTVNLSPVSPPIRFLAGSNANQYDLGFGNTIGVSIGSDGASLTLSLHPTVQRNYYLDVSRIENTDISKAYYITIRVVTAASLQPGSQARLLIYDAPSGGSIVADVDLQNTGDISAGTISSGAVWRIDLYIFIPEGSFLLATSAEIQLIYSPSNEAPPTVPP